MFFLLALKSHIGYKAKISTIYENKIPRLIIWRHVTLHMYDPMNFLSAKVICCNFCEQFEPRSGSTKCNACTGSKLFDTLMVFLKVFLEKLWTDEN